MNSKECRCTLSRMLMHIKSNGCRWKADECISDECICTTRQKNAWCGLRHKYAQAHALQMHAHALQLHAHALQLHAHALQVKCMRMHFKTSQSICTQWSSECIRTISQINADAQLVKRRQMNAYAHQDKWIDMHNEVKRMHEHKMSREWHVTCGTHVVHDTSLHMS